jgi:hypothetical protein
VPKVSDEHLEARREEILGGARRAFARHGSIEITRHLRTNPELMQEFEQHGGEELGRRVRDRFRELHAEGGSAPT